MARATVVRPDFERLPERFERLPRELRQLVKEQHAPVRERHLAGLGALATAGKRRLRGAMVRLAIGRAHHQPSAVQHPGHAVDHADLQRLALA